MTRSIFSGGATSGALRISAKLPVVKSSVREEACSERSRLFGVMMMSGLTKSRFI